MIYFDSIFQQFGHEFLTWQCLPLLLRSKLLNTAAVDLEFVVAEAALVLGRVLVVRDG